MINLRSDASSKHGVLTTVTTVAKGPRTGQFGGALSTADITAGRRVLWARSRVGVLATQSWPKLYLAIDALSLLGSGLTAAAALAKGRAGDQGYASWGHLTVTEPPALGPERPAPLGVVT
jgi:hypothetical protein